MEQACTGLGMVQAGMHDGRGHVLVFWRQLQGVAYMHKTVLNKSSRCKRQKSASLQALRPADTQEGMPHNVQQPDAAHASPQCQQAA